MKDTKKGPLTTRRINGGAILSGIGFLLYLAARALGWELAADVICIVFGVIAVLTFLDFSFLVCFFCVNSLVELPLRGLLSNTARYVFLSVPTNLGLLLTLCALLLLICIKQFLLIFSPLWLCLYGGLTFVSHKRGIRHYMTAA